MCYRLGDYIGNVRGEGRSPRETASVWVILGVLLLAGLAAAPAWAREDQTITVHCEPSGFTFEADANSLFGQITANAQLNALNPFGETCQVIG